MASKAEDIRWVERRRELRTSETCC